MTAAQEVKLFINEHYSDTFFRVDPNTLQIYADTDESGATVFLRSTAGSGPRTYQVVSTGKYMTLDASSEAILGNGESGNSNNDFYPITTGVPGGDVALQAANKMIVTADTTSSSQLLANTVIQNPLPWNCVLESVVI